MGSRSWGDADGEEEDEEDGGDAEGELVDEKHLSVTRVPRMLSDLEAAIQSRPDNFHVNRPHSLSPKGMQSAHDVRVRKEDV